MAKVNVGDLVSANNSSMLKKLEEASNNLKNIKNNINNFKNTSTNELVGSGYDTLRMKLDLYIDCLEKLDIICNNLSQAIPNANNTMIGFMEGYSELDDSKIPEVEAQLQAAKDRLAWLQSYHTETDSNGNTIRVRNGTDAEIAECMALIKELEHLLEKLKLLAPTDRSAFSKINAVNTDIISYANALLGIKVTDLNSTNQNSKTNGIIDNEGNAYEIKEYYAFDQRDSKWQKSGYHSYEGSDIAEGGCAVCSSAACLSTILQDSTINPYTVGKVMGENHWTNYGGNFVGHLGEYYGIDTDMYFGSNYQSVGANNEDKRLEYMTNLVNNGGAMVLSQNDGAHYIAVTGYDNTTGKYIVADSYPELSNQSSNLQYLSGEEIMSKNISMWEAFAPVGMTVSDAIKPKGTNA